MTNKENRTRKKKNSREYFKIPYFDELAAQDYLDNKNGGRFDWSTQENKEKIAKIIAEMDAEFSGSIGFLDFLRAGFKTKGESSRLSEMSEIFDSKLCNTIMTDYIKMADSDENVKVFSDIHVMPYPNSFTVYKLFSPYLTIVPKEEMPIDFDKLNQAVLGERGYYELVASDDKNNKMIFRFNINSFRNGYHLPDLFKMNLTYYGVCVGEMNLDKLSIDKEFCIDKTEITAEKLLDMAGEEEKNICEVYDIVMAGVSFE